MEAIAEARELGDLKENGAYLAGREQQGFIVGRIRELNGMLSRSDIIDCTKVEPDLAACLAPLCLCWTWIPIRR